MLQYFPGTVTEKNGRSAKELFVDVFENVRGVKVENLRKGGGDEVGDEGVGGEGMEGLGDGEIRRFGEERDGV